MSSNDNPPEVSIDFHSGWGADSFSLTTTRTKQDIAKLGLSLDQMVGKEFIFNGGLDMDDDGVHVDMLCRGTVQKHPQAGYVAVCDLDKVYRRRQRAQQAVQRDGPASGGSAR